jgi:hypothetical protein
MIRLVRVPKSNPALRQLMPRHYSAPKGFVARSICYLVEAEGRVWGATVAGSATRFLPGRYDFFGIEHPLNNLVNNTFFHIEKQDDRYPCRNFAQKIVRAWRDVVALDWLEKYGDEVLGWETLV